MGEPVVVNGVPVDLHQGPNTRLSAFSLGSLKVNAGGFPVVLPTSLLGGKTFVATLFTVKTLVGGLPVILVGATVTDSDGFVGVLNPAHGAGLKFNLV